MLNSDGTYSITADELAALVAGEDFWWILPDGTFASTPTRWHPGPIVGYFMPRDEQWIAQWDGDWQRACDAVLNPALSSNEPLFPDLNAPPGGSDGEDSPV